MENLLLSTTLSSLALTEKVQLTLHMQHVLSQPGFTPDASNQQLGDAPKTLVLAEAHFMQQ